MTTDFNTAHESIIALITRRQAELGRTDEEITQELGFARVNTFCMIREGAVKLPVSKVAVLASALSIEPAHLLRRLLAEAMPDVLTAVDELLCPMSLTANERKLIQTFRHLSKGNDVNPIVVDSNSIVALMIA
jgi:hypothetical protein